VIGFYADSSLTRSGLGYVAAVRMIVEREEHASVVGKRHGANVMQLEYEFVLSSRRPIYIACTEDNINRQNYHAISERSSCAYTRYRAAILIGSRDGGEISYRQYFI
jgi:hypothetical protein